MTQYYPHSVITDLVIVIWTVAGPALTGVFEQAIARVTSF